MAHKSMRPIMNHYVHPYSSQLCVSERKRTCMNSHKNLCLRCQGRLNAVLFFSLNYIDRSMTFMLFADRTDTIFHEPE